MSHTSLTDIVKVLKPELELMAKRILDGRENVPLSSEERRAADSLKHKLRDFVPDLCPHRSDNSEVVHINQVVAEEKIRESERGNGFTKVLSVAVAIPTMVLLLPVLALAAVGGLMNGGVEGEELLAPRFKHLENVADYFGNIALKMGFGNPEVDVPETVERFEPMFKSALVKGAVHMGYVFPDGSPAVHPRKEIGGAKARPVAKPVGLSPA